MPARSSTSVSRRRRSPATFSSSAAFSRVATCGGRAAVRRGRGARAATSPIPPRCSARGAHGDLLAEHGVLEPRLVAVALGRAEPRRGRGELVRQDAPLGRGLGRLRDPARLGLGRPAPRARDLGLGRDARLALAARVLDRVGARLAEAGGLALLEGLALPPERLDARVGRRRDLARARLELLAERVALERQAPLQVRDLHALLLDGLVGPEAAVLGRVRALRLGVGDVALVARLLPRELARGLGVADAPRAVRLGGRRRPDRVRRLGLVRRELRVLGDVARAVRLDARQAHRRGAAGLERLRALRLAAPRVLELRGDPRQVVAQQLLALRRAVREALVLGAEPLVRPLGRVAPLGRVERRARAFEPRGLRPLRRLDHAHRRQLAQRQLVGRPRAEFVDERADGRGCRLVAARVDGVRQAVAEPVVDGVAPVPQRLRRPRELDGLRVGLPPRRVRVAPRGRQARVVRLALGRAPLVRRRELRLELPREGRRLAAEVGKRLGQRQRRRRGGAAPGARPCGRRAQRRDLLVVRGRAVHKYQTAWMEKQAGGLLGSSPFLCASRLPDVFKNTELQYRWYLL